MLKIPNLRDLPSRSYLVRQDANIQSHPGSGFLSSEGPWGLKMAHGAQILSGTYLSDYWTRADSRFAPSQWETALLCNDVSYWPGASLESALLDQFLLKHWGLNKMANILQMIILNAFSWKKAVCVLLAISLKFVLLTISQLCFR